MEDLKFRPPKRLLTGQEITEMSLSTSGVSLTNRGSKRTDPEFNKEEDCKIEEYKEELKVLLGLERVATTKSRSFGVYEPNNKRVRVEKNEGKWLYGFKVNQSSYLHLHEALYLMEMNRMVVEHHSMTMSIEQAFAEFLDPEKSHISLPQYLIYSKMMRFGYILYTHDAESDQETYDAEVLRQGVSIQNELTWICLLENLNLPVHHQIIDENPKLYETIKKEMEKTCDNIMVQKSSYKEEPLMGAKFWKSTNIVNSSFKRKVDKIRKHNVAKTIKMYAEHGRFLDILKVGPSYNECKEIFDQFDIIEKLDISNDSDLDGDKDLNFDFDVYLPNSNHKKSDLPDFRMFVVCVKDGIPTNKDILKLYHKQYCKVPIIMVIAFELCKFHCYVFDF